MRTAVETKAEFALCEGFDRQHGSRAAQACGAGYQTMAGIFWRTVQYNRHSAVSSQDVASVYQRAMHHQKRGRPRMSWRSLLFRQRVRTMGIKEVKTAPRSPWQNPYVERLIGSIRRDCLNHVVILHEQHLQRILASYLASYHRWWTHLSLAMDCPEPRPVHPADEGRVIAVPSPTRRPSSATTAGLRPGLAVRPRCGQTCAWRHAFPHAAGRARMPSMPRRCSKRGRSRAVR